MSYTPEQEAWILLSSVRGLGTQRFNRLLETFGSARDAWEQNAGETAFLGKVMNQALQKAKTDEHRRAVFDALERCGAAAVTREDAEYPALLRELPDAPPTLYVRGQIALDEMRAAAVVGSRNCSAYGTRMARRLGRELSEMGVTVVSGFARGIDTAAHRGAVDTGSRTVAVFGSGVDVVYPPENLALADELLACGGSIVSANPPGTSPHASVFPARNRIISGMCEGTVIVEAAKDSGAMITADFALAQGRALFAVPGQADSIRSAGAHALIRAGRARLITSAADLVQDLGWQCGALAAPAAPRAAKILPLTQQEQAVYNLLGGGPVDGDTLPETLGLPVNEVNSLLTSLEIRGIIKQSPGHRFERVSE